MPSARSKIDSATLNSKICIIGGFDDAGRSSSAVEVYDPNMDECGLLVPKKQKQTR